jgi:hypothetical protein
MKFGRNARQAIPILTEVEGQDHDNQVRSFATKALEKLQAVK